MSWVAHKVLAAIADEGALSTVAITRASGVAGKSLENAIYRLRARAFIALAHKKAGIGKYASIEDGDIVILRVQQAPCPITMFQRKRRA